MPFGVIDITILEGMHRKSMSRGMKPEHMQAVIIMAR